MYFQSDIPFEERASVSRAMESRCVAELLGMARLLDFTGQITAEQQSFIRQWLAEVPRAVQCWPIPEARKIFSGTPDRILPFLRELLQTQAEHDAMLAEQEKKGEGNSPVDAIFTEPVPKIIFLGESFCFTGNFVDLRRDDCETIVSNLGGHFSDKSSWCSYLVVGSKGNKHWAQKNFGRKIQEALDCNRMLREEPWRKPVVIVREDDWKAAVEKEVGMPLSSYLDSLMGYRPSATPVKVDWEHHALRVLSEMFDSLPDIIDWTQSKKLFVVYHPCKQPRLVLLKLGYGKYGITRVINAEGDIVYTLEDGWRMGKKTRERLQRQLWGEE